LNQWVRGADTIHARYGHGAVACQGCAYVIGGTDGKADLDSIEKYDNFTNSWQGKCFTSINKFGPSGIYTK